MIILCTTVFLKTMAGIGKLEGNVGVIWAFAALFDTVILLAAIIGFAPA